MRGLKSVASIAALVLLAACSTVKLDDQAPVEDRVAKTNTPSSGAASSSIPGSGAKASGPKDAAAKDAAAREAAAKEAAAREAAAAEAAREAAARDAAAAAKDPLNDPASILANRSVYFDFDSFVIRDEFKSIVEAHGKFLSGNPNRKVVIQGHTDERGGSEYNLALGQKRAEAVRRALSLAGAKDSQMEAVSFGKEKPKAVGSNEEAWSQNRRADIAY